MSKERFTMLMYSLYNNNQLFIPQGEILEEWIDKTFEKWKKK